MRIVFFLFRVEIFFCQVRAKYFSESGCWDLTLQDCGEETVIDKLRDIAPCIETGIYSVWNNLDNNFTKSRSQGRVFLTDSSLSSSSLQYWIQPNELILLCKFNSSRRSFQRTCREIRYCCVDFVIWIGLVKVIIGCAVENVASSLSLNERALRMLLSSWISEAQRRKIPR